MSNKYYDSWLQSRIIRMIDIDPYTASDLFDTYLRKYPKDCLIYPYYANNLIVLNEFLSALEVMKLSDQLAIKNKVVKKKKAYYHEIMAYAIIKYFMYQQKYQELYDFINNYEYMLDSIDFEQARFYAMKQLGILSEKQKYKFDKSYLYRQIIDYDYNEFLRHIEKHMAEYVYDYYAVKLNVFNLDFPMNEVLCEIKKYIPSGKKLFTGFVEDKYFFKYDGCGRGFESKRAANFFEVIAFHGTDQLITMYPVLDNQERLPYIDLNYLNTVKVKRKSQIERFNERYKRS